MKHLRRTAAAALLGMATAAHASPNSLNDEFSAHTEAVRAERIGQQLSSMGQRCQFISKEMFQGALPDGTALWSFSCAYGSDYQLIIFVDRSIKFMACEELAKRKDLVACFAPVPKKP
jgi:hypothetical protein